MNRLENKVAVITGAASGMGRAMALLFAEKGSKIIAADINQARLETHWKKTLLPMAVP